jgi:hypothetical protein
MVEEAPKANQQIDIETATDSIIGQGTAEAV